MELLPPRTRPWIMVGQNRRPPDGPGVPATGAHARIFHVTCPASPASVPLMTRTFAAFWYFYAPSHMAAGRVCAF